MTRIPVEAVDGLLEIVDRRIDEKLHQHGLVTSSDPPFEPEDWGRPVDPRPVDRDTFDRELAAMVGELRDVQIDVGSFLALSTEATNEQRLALARLVHRYRGGPRGVARVTVSIGTYGLPRDYVHALLRDADGDVVLEAGIDPEGRVST